MNGKELQNRLNEDIQKSIRAMSVVRTIAQMKADFLKYAANPAYELNYSMEENGINMTVEISLHANLTDINQFINFFGEEIMTTTPLSFADVPAYLAEFQAKSEQIASNFQRMLDDENYVFLNLGAVQPLHTILTQRLDNIHNDAESVDRCYHKLTESK